MDKVAQAVEDMMSPPPLATREDMAKALGVSISTLNNKLAGRSEWRWREVRTVSRLSGVPLNELASDEDGESA